MRVRRGGAYDHLQPVGSCDAQLLRCFSSEDGRKLTCLNRPPAVRSPPSAGETGRKWYRRFFWGSEARSRFPEELALQVSHTNTCGKNQNRFLT